MTSSEIKYLTVLKELQDSGIRVRAVDLADRLVCSKPSITRAMEKLISRKLVQRTPTREFLLTERGAEIAAGFQRDLEFLRGMLARCLGLHPSYARADALAILGAVSDDCARKLSALALQRNQNEN